MNVHMSAIRALAILGELRFSDMRRSYVQSDTLPHLGTTKSTVMKLKVHMRTI